jgi:FkbM family methyltransferase
VLLSLITWLERGAAVLRRIGFGAVVDWVRDRTLDRFGRLSVDVDGIKLSGVAAHSHYVRELRDDDRERRMADLFEQAVPPRGFVLDVGAHLGYFTLLAARRGADVIAFEPNPRTLAHLRANIAANDAAARVTVVPKALAAAAGRRPFHLSLAGDTSSLHEQDETVAAVDVEVTTADAVVGPRAVDVIKLDVEGSEVAALTGARNTISEHRPLLQLEVEAERLARQGLTRDAVLRLLDELDYVPYVFDLETAQLRPPRLPDEPEGTIVAGPRGWTPPLLAA